jgi:hypothetical protein
MLDTIAGKWVRNQRIAEPAGQMIDPVIPVQGNAVTFARLIQVDGDEALKLELELESREESTSWLARLVLLGLIAVSVLMGVRLRGRKVSA